MHNIRYRLILRRPRQVRKTSARSSIEWASDY